MRSWLLWCSVSVLALACQGEPAPADAMSRPARPKSFASPDDLRLYLDQLGQYYAVAGRPSHERTRHYLLEKRFTCFEEVYGIGDDGSRRYADIIAFSKDSNVAYVVDPTIRYETNDPEQAEKIDLEKRKIYEPCVNFYHEKYREQFVDREFRVRGLWFGSRGTSPPRTLQFFQEVGIDHVPLHGIVEDIIIDSLAILNFHVYA